MRDSRLPRTHPALPTSPYKRVPVRIPVRRGPFHRRADIVPRRKPPPLQRQGPQHLPPRFDQVEIGRVGGLKDELPARMGQTPEQDVGCPVRAQVVQDRVDPGGRIRQPRVHGIQKRDPVDGRPSRIGRRERRAGRGLEGAEHVSLAAPPIVRFLRRPGAPLAGGIVPDRLLPVMALRTLRPDFIQTDYGTSGGWSGVQLDNRPLFSTNAGSTRSPNHVSWVRQRSPSACRISPIRLRLIGIAFASLR